MDDANQKHARIVLGGERIKGEGFDDGFYFPPTLIADATHNMLVLTEETFGPILGLCSVDNARDGLSHANDNRYGLAGFVFKSDSAKGLMLCEGMEVGSVWLNEIHRSSHYVPFGGMKESGLGREKGHYGLESYLEYKTMYLSYDEPT
ncbi:MAG: succinate-semialdehyde dehydrogenase/glutarate-semialdehyde dehydrogenase [Granulosicoccus sp.]